MTATPPPSKRQVNRAARLLADSAVNGVPVDDAAAVDDAVATIDWWRRRHSRTLSEVAAELHGIADRLGIGDAEVSQRLKRHDTVVEKLGRFPSMELTRMEDIAGARVVVPTQVEADTIAQRIREHQGWSVRRVRNYVDGRDPGPKQDGYRAIHVIIEQDQRYVEIQLRTDVQDSWAQAVEDLTYTLGAALKFGGGPENLRRYFKELGDSLAVADVRGRPALDVAADMRRLIESIRRSLPPHP